MEITIEEYKSSIAKRNKYGAKKTVCELKHTHDSKKECTRCSTLNVLKRSGNISRLKYQTKFILQRGFTINGEKIRPIYYLADFTYWEDGVYIIEDVKGRRVPVFLIKRKMLLNKIKNKKNWKFIET